MTRTIGDPLWKGLGDGRCQHGLTRGAEHRCAHPSTALLVVKNPLDADDFGTKYLCEDHLADATSQLNGRLYAPGYTVLRGDEILVHEVMTQ